MRAFVLWSGLVVAGQVGVFGLACSLTTDLGPLTAGDGDAAEAGLGRDGAGDGAADAASDAEPGADASDYRSVVMADGPIAYYRFEDPVDANAAKDEVGSHDAAKTGAGITFQAEGVSGRGARLDGSDALDVGDVFDFAGRSPFTLETWVNPGFTGSDQHLFRKRDESNPADFQGYILYLAEDRSAHFEGWGVNLSAFTDPLTQTGFIHIVLTVAYENGKGNARFFVDGQPLGKGGFDNTLDLADTAERLRIVSRCKGTVDELAIYDKALSPARILAHYRAGKP